MRLLDGIPTTSAIIATADAGGIFQITGACTDTTYTLIASLDGGLTLHEIHGARAGGAAVQLELAAVFAGVVRLRGPDGLALRSGTSVFGRGPGWYDEADRAAVIVGVPVACKLAMDRSLWALGATTTPDHLVMLAGEDDGLVSLDVI